MTKLFSQLLLLAFASTANAALVEFSGTPDGDGVHPVAKVKTDGGAVELKLIGHAVRKKYLGVFSKPIYRVASYGSGDSVAKSSTRLIVMQMQMSLSAAQVRASFIEGLRNNGVDVSQPVVQRILGAFSTGASTDDVTHIVGSRNGVESLSIELFNGDKIAAAVSEKAPTLMTDLWKVWCGDPTKADRGLREIQSTVCGVK